MKLKVMILANDTTYTYNLRNEIIERLASDGHEVVVASQPLLLQNELKSLGCRLVNIETNRHGTNPLSDFGLLMKFRQVLSDERPDVVLTYNIKPNAYGGIACRMTKTHYIPNITGLGTAVVYPGLLQKISTKLYKVGVAGADCIMFQNEENRHFFIDHHMMPKKARARLLPGSGVSLKVHKAMEYPADIGVINSLVGRAAGLGGSHIGRRGLSDRPGPCGPVRPQRGGEAVPPQPRERPGQRGQPEAPLRDAASSGMVSRRAYRGRGQRHPRHGDGVQGLADQSEAICRGLGGHHETDQRAPDRSFLRAQLQEAGTDVRAAIAAPKPPGRHKRKRAHRSVFGALSAGGIHLFGLTIPSGARPHGKRSFPLRQEYTWITRKLFDRGPSGKTN